jgi:L-ascorbate metabolism protein UlaG (beta-lactamase superfamily)
VKTAGLFALLLFPLFVRAADWRRYIPPASAESIASIRAGVRVTYLGTNGYLLEGAGTKLLVDPYFTRFPLATAALNRRVNSSPEKIQAALRRLPRKIDGILVTHGHFDHLLDVPPIAIRTGAQVLASRSSIFLAEAADLPHRQSKPMRAGQSRRIGSARITALRASHDRLFGCCVPFPGDLTHPPHEAPDQPKDWVLGEPLAFLIELAGKRIYIDSGGTMKVLPETALRPIDLAIVGVALPDARGRLSSVLSNLQPRYFLPSHQDDFFRPMDDGFVFGKMTNFRSVVRSAEQAKQRLIMLDYFRPWTLR